MKHAKQWLLSMLAKRDVRAALVAFGVLGAIVLYVYRADVVFYLSPKDSCFSEENVRVCMRDKAHYIAMSGDVIGAIRYTAEVVAPYNRNTAHLAMHMVGMQAYDQLGSRKAAMDTLPPEAPTYANYLTYEGFQHGLLMEYFKVERSRTPIDQLIHESCADHWVPTNPMTEDFSWTANMQCFHAVGHGLMYAYENKVSDVLPICSRLPYEWMRGRCAYGALMEKSYLYSVDYINSLKLPKQQEGDSMLSLCNGLTVFKTECSLFVGRSYLNTHRGDFAGAFAACAKLDVAENAFSCREQVASISITDSGTDFDTMHKRCATAGPFEEQCLLNVATAVKRGFAGKAAQKKDFCKTLQKELTKRCEAINVQH